MLIKVAVLSALRLKAHHDIFPLRVFRSCIEREGVTVSFHHRGYDLTRARYDVVFISSYSISRAIGQSQTRLQFVKELKQNVGGIIWFDSSDSGNVAHADILPYVDVYAKGQLWKDRELYRQPLYQGLLFKDYYYHHYGIEEDEGSFSEGLADEHIEKLHVAWNLAFSDWRLHSRKRLHRAIGVLFPWSVYRVEPIKTPLKERTIDVSYRAPNRGQRIVDFQREMIGTLVDRIVPRLSCRIGQAQRLPYKQYLNEMAEARVVPSPFGWGEICYRDCECFRSGAVLFKPDIQHLETYPNLYEEGVTYVPHSWDLSDFESKLEEIIAEPDRFQNIATAGQNRFLSKLQSEEGEVFAARFAGLVRLAMG